MSDTTQTTNCEACGASVAPPEAYLTEDDVLLCPKCLVEIKDCINAEAQARAAL